MNVNNFSIFKDLMYFMLTLTLFSSGILMNLMERKLKYLCYFSFELRTSWYVKLNKLYGAIRNELYMTRFVLKTIPLFLEKEYYEVIINKVFILI